MTLFDMDNTKLSFIRCFPGYLKRINFHFSCLIGPNNSKRSILSLLSVTTKLIKYLVLKAVKTKKNFSSLCPMKLDSNVYHLRLSSKFCKLADGAYKFTFTKKSTIFYYWFNVIGVDKLLGKNLSVRCCFC